jgi:VWFA-related protein
MRRSAVLLAILALALPLAAQTQTAYQEKVDVNVVLLDAIVTDAQGHQILGLGKDDFVVKESGVEQPLETVDYFTNRRLLDAREENAPFKVERVREDRYFIFFFDKPNDPGVLFDELNRARDAARKFIDKRMLATDRVAIAGHDGRLKIYSDFTNDKKQLQRALDEALRFGKGLKSGGSADAPSILHAIDTGAMINHTGTVYEALDLLADAVRPIRARKNLVLFSPGVLDPTETVTAGMAISRSPYLDPALQSLNAANVSVYPVQIQRDVDFTPAIHQRLQEFAQATGGRYFEFNTSFEPALSQIENVNNGYYLLSYRTKHAASETGFQKVSVSIRNQPKLRVNARAGYTYGG